MSISDKLITISENQQKVYNAGKKLQYDEFWDNFQDYGRRKKYKNAFLNADDIDVNTGWNEKTFNPKYDIKPVGITSFAFYQLQVGDFKQKLQNARIVLDMSGVTQFQYGFGYSQVTHLGILDFSECTNLGNAFEGCNQLISIDKIKLRDDGNVLLTKAFAQNTKLEDIVIEGCIGDNINFQWSTNLTKDSIKSVINALSPTNGFVATFSRLAVIKAFGSISSGAWLTLIESKPNWTITLV